MRICHLGNVELPADTANHAKADHRHGEPEYAVKCGMLESA